MAILVVANVTATSATLLDALRHRAEGRDASFTLLMPATHPGISGREADQPRLEAALEAWREAGLECDGMVGDDDPVVAVQEAWDPRRFDEIIVSTLPGHASKWLRFDLPHRIAALTDARVTHVVDIGETPRRTWPAPQHERHPLGPLSVLAWGGRPPERATRSS